MTATEFETLNEDELFNCAGFSEWFPEDEVSEFRGRCGNDYYLCKPCERQEFLDDE